MKKQAILIILLSLAVVVVLAACGGTPASSSSTSGAALDGKALTETRCTSCHGLNRAEKVTKASNWPILVDNMVGRGAQLNGSEKTAVVQFLTSNFSN